MTHKEYLARIETFTDSSDDVERVLEHSDSCALCRTERRAANRALSRLESVRSLPEEIARWGATAAVLALILSGLHKETRGPAPASTARYRIVGDASGVVAYTPEGIVVGTAARTRPSNKEIAR